jgi:hypothetical protein
MFKDTLSKLTPENIKRAALLANQDQREVTSKPIWEERIKKELEFSENCKWDVRVLNLIRQTIKEEREQATKEESRRIKASIPESEFNRWNDFTNTWEAVIDRDWWNNLFN